MREKQKQEDREGTMSMPGWDQKKLWNYREPSNTLPTDLPPDIETAAKNFMKALGYQETNP